MKWHVTGADASTGAERTIVVDAVDDAEATAKGNYSGLMVERAVREQPPLASIAYATRESPAKREEQRPSPPLVLNGFARTVYQPASVRRLLILTGVVCGAAVLLAGIAYVVSDRGRTPVASPVYSFAPTPQAAKPDFDKSAETQALRLKTIEKLVQSGHITKFEPGSRRNLAYVWVNKELLDVGRKNPFLYVFYTYYFDSYDPANVIVVNDSVTGRLVGEFREDGLSRVDGDLPPPLSDR